MTSFILVIDLGFQVKGGRSISQKKKKKLQIGIHIILANYKYKKLLFLRVCLGSTYFAEIKIFLLKGTVNKSKN